MLALGAALSTSYATANASDYVSVTGIKFVDGGTPAAGTAPSTAGLVRHTQRHIYSVQFFREILLRVSLTPYDARSQVTMPIPGALLPEASMLSVADANNADQMILWEAGYGGQEIDWAMANADITSFIHKKRCASGVDGTMVTSPGGVTYKKCPENSSNNVMAVTATYQLPPFVCAQTCDQNPGCTAYAVDSAQQNCYIGGPSGGGANYTMYFRLPGL